MSERVRIAVAGLGAVARAVYLPILTRRSDRFEIVAVCDLSSAVVRATGQRFGIPAQRCFTAVDQMLDTADADALAILTSGSHGGLAEAALDHGIAVLCEKPLGTTLREAGDLARAVGGRPDRFMLAYMKVYDPAVTRAATIVADRSRPRAVDVTVLHPSTASQLELSEHGPGTFDLPAATRATFDAHRHALEVEALGDAADTFGSLYSGVLLGSVVHDLAVLRALGAPITTVDFADRWADASATGSVAFHGRTDDDVRVTVQWHYLHDHPRYREQVRWHDAQGSVELEFPSPYLLRAPTLLRSSTAVPPAVDERHVSSHVEAFEEQLLAFHAMVTDGVVPAAGVEQGRADIALCQRVVAALAAREGVALGGEAGARRDVGRDELRTPPAT